MVVSVITLITMVNYPRGNYPLPPEYFGPTLGSTGLRGAVEWPRRSHAAPALPTGCGPTRERGQRLKNRRTGQSFSALALQSPTPYKYPCTHCTSIGSAARGHFDARSSGAQPLRRSVQRRAAIPMLGSAARSHSGGVAASGPAACLCARGGDCEAGAHADKRGWTGGGLSAAPRHHFFAAGFFFADFFADFLAGFFAADFFAIAGRTGGDTGR